MSAAVWVGNQCRDYLGDLVDAALWVARRPRPPLLPVNWPEVTVFIGPFVPDFDTMVVQVFDVRIAAEKPQQFGVR